MKKIVICTLDDHECDLCTTRVKNGSYAWAIDAMFRGEKVTNINWESCEYCTIDLATEIYFDILDEDGETVEKDVLPKNGYSLYVEKPEKKIPSFGSKTFDLGAAINHLKSGLKIRRSSWAEGAHILMDENSSFVSNARGNHYGLSWHEINVDDWELYDEK